MPPPAPPVKPAPAMLTEHAERRSPMTIVPVRPFSARRPNAPLKGRIRVPGDKSISHRALIFGALAVGETRIDSLLEGEDVLRTAAAMRALGAEIQREGPGRWLVSGRGVGGLAEPENVLDMGNSGTAARLLCGMLASHDLFAVLTGDLSLRRRPMGRVIEPLSACGAFFSARRGGRLPLAIVGARDPLALEYRLPVASAQVKSAILLAGLNARGITRVEEPAPTRDHSERMLRHFGADVSVTIAGAGRMIHLSGQSELKGAEVAVPGDPSSAAFPIAAALLVKGSEIHVEQVGLNPLRTGFFHTLREMGAILEVTNEHLAGAEPVGDISVRESELYAVDVPADRAPSMIDEYPILAVVAACARGQTRMRGLSELRVKESDRLAAIATLLAANGVKVGIEDDSLLVNGDIRPPPGGGLVATWMDHRLAMSALVLGQVTVEPVQVDDISFIDTSFPDFVDLMRQLGAVLEEK